MQYISNILYYISSGLLIPVILVLIYLFARALWLLATFFGQFVTVTKTEAVLKQSFDDLSHANADSMLDGVTKRGKQLLVAQCISKMLLAKGNEAKLLKHLSDFDIAAARDTALCKTLTKLGPMMGLMGTLIPMGPALVGLSTGDIASMAYNMQVAFATTVVGLASAAIGYVIGQVKNRWYQQDSVNLQYLADIVSEMHSENQEK